MNEVRRNRRSRRGGKTARLTSAEFWKAVPEPDAPDDIRPAPDPTALFRSLGPPPLTGQPGADRELAKVVARASAVATALAAVADLLAEDESPSSA